MSSCTLQAEPGALPGLPVADAGPAVQRHERRHVLLRQDLPGQEHLCQELLCQDSHILLRQDSQYLSQGDVLLHPDLPGQEHLSQDLLCQDSQGHVLLRQDSQYLNQGHVILRQDSPGNVFQCQDSQIQLHSDLRRSSRDCDLRRPPRD